MRVAWIVVVLCLTRMVNAQSKPEAKSQNPSKPAS